MRVIGLSAALATASILAAGITPAARQAPSQPPAQGPTFRVAVDYVEVDAIVTDRTGAFVGGLTKDDFEVLEDGKPQTVTAFSVVDLPVHRASPPASRSTPIEPDVRSNAGEFNGRVIVIVLDDIMVAPRNTPRVRAAAKQFINRYVAANDVVAVLHTRAGASSAQNFTSNRALILAAIDKFTGQKIESATASVLGQPPPRPNAGDPAEPLDPLRFERAARGRETLSQLRSASEYLASVRGRRKALLWFSEGIDSDYENPMDQQGTLVRDEMTMLIGAAQRAGVSVYAVDPRGLGAGLDEAIDIRGLPDDPTSRLGVTGILDEVRRSQSALRSISTETGGFAVTGGGDINTHFEKVVEENSSYYLLGYYPAVDRRDGKFRALEVRVKRPGVTVRHRKGYAAPRGRPDTQPTSRAAADAPPELRAAIESPLPLAGVPMRVFAAPFRTPGKTTAVAIVLELLPSALRFEKRGDGYVETLEMLIVPVNAAGKALDGARDEAPLKLSAKSYELIRANGIRFARRLDLPPGRYQLHVAAQSGTSKAVGALTYDLDVPDFSKGPLSMSGIALMSVDSDRIPTPRPGEGFTEVLPMAATALRDFERSDTLFSFAEVYAATTGTPHAVQVQTTVTGEDGTVGFRRTEERRSDELKETRGALRHSSKVPLAGFSPGRYVLRVEARALVTNGARIAREVEFRVR